MNGFSVNPGLTPNTGSGNSRPTKPRRRNVVENDEYAAFIRRIIKAFARRISTGDVEALRDMVALSTQLDDSISEAVKGLRAYGELVGNRRAAQIRGSSSRMLPAAELRVLA